MKESILSALKSRNIVLSWLPLLALLLAFLIVCAIYIRPSELQVPVRSTHYGVTNIYNDRWFYLLSFPIFAVVYTLVHTLLAAKLNAIKDERFAVWFLILSAAGMLIALVLVVNLFRIVALSS